MTGQGTAVTHILARIVECLVTFVGFKQCFCVCVCSDMIIVSIINRAEGIYCPWK